MNRSGYGGVAGGLRPVVAAFDPELVLVSPLARALQTALVATEGGGGAESVPILVHPALAEVGGGVGPHATPANTCKHLPHLAGGQTARQGWGAPRRWACCCCCCCWLPGQQGRASRHH
jgi:broad specificity phosphatase PhoE